MTRSRRLRDRVWFQLLTVIALLAIATVAGSLFFSRPTASLNWEQLVLSSWMKSIREWAPYQRATRADLSTEIEFANRSIRSAKQPDDKGNAYATRAYLVQFIGRCDLAFRDLNTAIAIPGTSNSLRAVLLYDHGMFQLRRSNLREASQDMDRATRLSPNETGLEYGRALVALRQGKAKFAANDLRRIIGQLPGTFAKQRVETEAFLRGFSSSERKVFLSHMAESQRRLAGQLYGSLGAADRAGGEDEKSLEDYTTAMSYAPRDAALYFGRGRTRLAARNFSGGLYDLVSGVWLNLSTIRTRLAVPPCSVEP